MKSQEESKLKTAIYNWLKIQPNNFCWVNRTVGIPNGRGGFRTNNMSGISDITGVYNGKFYALEVKTEKGIVSENQRKFLQRVADANGYGAIVRSFEDAEECFEEIKRVL